MKVQIIGKGRVGYSFYLFLKGKGFDVKIFSRHNGGELFERGDILFIASKDAEIEEVSRQYSNLDFSVFCHFSGALTSEILPKDKERASFHPLQAFHEPNPDLWDGITVVVEGTDKAVNVLRDLSENLGLRFKTIERDKKVLYHAAAVLLSNLIYVPLITSERIFKGLGLQREDYEKLLLTSVKNFIRFGRDGLTGPLRRGDFKTVEMHKKALKGLDREIYERLTEFLIYLYEYEQV